MYWQADGLPIHSGLYPSIDSDELFGHLCAGEDVEMQVRNGLSGGLAGVGDDAEALVKALLRGYLRNDLEDVGHGGGVFGGYLGRGVRDVLLGDDQDVGRGLGLMSRNARTLSSS